MASMPSEGMSFDFRVQAKRVYKFLFYDVPGVMYDHEPDGNAYLSLPRFMYSLFGIMTLIAFWRGVLTGGDIIGVFGIAAGGYVSKRIFPLGGGELDEIKNVLKKGSDNNGNV